MDQSVRLCIHIPSTAINAITGNGDNGGAMIISRTVTQPTTTTWGKLCQTIIESDLVECRLLLPFLTSLSSKYNYNTAADNDNNGSNGGSKRHRRRRLSHYRLRYGDECATIARPSWADNNDDDGDDLVEEAFMEVNVSLRPTSSDDNNNNTGSSSSGNDAPLPLPHQGVLSFLHDNRTHYTNNNSNDNTNNDDGPASDEIGNIIHLTLHADTLLGRYGNGPLPATIEGTHLLDVKEHPFCLGFVDWFRVTKFNNHHQHDNHNHNNDDAGHAAGAFGDIIENWGNLPKKWIDFTTIAPPTNDNSNNNNNSDNDDEGNTNHGNRTIDRIASHEEGNEKGKRSTVADTNNAAATATTTTKTTNIARKRRKANAAKKALEESKAVAYATNAKTLPPPAEAAVEEAAVEEAEIAVEGVAKAANGKKNEVTTTTTTTMASPAKAKASPAKTKVSPAKTKETPAKTKETPAKASQAKAKASPKEKVPPAKKATVAKTKTNTKTNANAKEKAKTKTATKITTPATSAAAASKKAAGAKPTTSGNKIIETAEDGEKAEDGDKEEGEKVEGGDKEKEDAVAMAMATGEAAGEEGVGEAAGGEGAAGEEAAKGATPTKKKANAKKQTEKAGGVSTNDDDGNKKENDATTAPATTTTTTTTPSTTTTPATTPATTKQSTPKRPLNAYHLFCRDYRQKMAEKDPTASHAIMEKKMGDAYKALDPKEKKRYQNNASKAMAKYNRENGIVGGNSSSAVKETKKKEPPNSTATKSIHHPTGDKYADIPSQPSEMFPKGWVTRHIKRADGVREDTYFFSPVENFRFRSTTEVNLFLEHLKRAKGDESVAIGLFKEKKPRGEKGGNAIADKDNSGSSGSTPKDNGEGKKSKKASAKKRKLETDAKGGVNTSADSSDNKGKSPAKKKKFNPVPRSSVEKVKSDASKADGDVPQENTDGKNDHGNKGEAADKKNAKKHKKASEIDKNKPKKPANAYIRFSSKVRAEITKDHPDWGPQEVARKIGEKWRDLNVNEKKVYEDETKSALAEHNKASGIDNNKPKRPVNAYIRFSNKVRTQITKDHPDLDPKDVARKIGEKWRDLDINKKKVYEDETKSAQAQHKIELAKYEASKKESE